MKQKSLFESIPAKQPSPRKGVKKASKLFRPKAKLEPSRTRDENTDIVQLINRRQRQILLHSYIYYDLDKNIISDHIFDKWCFELVDLVNRYPKENKQSEFYSDFIDFDGSTGMDLCYKQPWTMYWAEVFLSPKFRLRKDR